MSDFFSVRFNFFDIIGAITLFIALAGYFVISVGWLLGISTILKKLGLGRWNRMIWICAENQNYESLKKDLIASGIFRTKNIQFISPKRLSDLKDVDLAIIDCVGFSSEQLVEILSQKAAKAGFIFYTEKLLKIEDRDRINAHPSCILVNFRGRLVNDVLVSMVSTGYAKK